MTKNAFASSKRVVTVADLLNSLGGVPAERVRIDPLPGTGTEQDVIEIDAREDRLCELINGTLIEKPLGFHESVLAGLVATELHRHVYPRKLGFVSGAGGMMQLRPGLIRSSDVAFVSRSRLVGGRLPQKPVPELSPDLAVEVLCEGHTESEMDRKRQEYFAAGTRLIWMVDPSTRSVKVYTPDRPEEPATLTAGDTLDGGAVLPGFEMPLAPMFALLDG